MIYMLQVCQTLMYVDIISLDPTSDLCSVKLPRKLCKLAVERGIFFEVSYVQYNGFDIIHKIQGCS